MGGTRRIYRFLGIFYLIGVLSVTNGEDVSVQVNLKRLVNIVSDKYVSYSIDPKVLLENINLTDSAMSDFMAKQLKPSHLKITGNSFFKLLSALSQGEYAEELPEHIPETVWTNFNRWIHSVDWTPIIPLPYNPNNWDSIQALKILNISSSLGIRDCIWQLGIDFDPTDAPRYVDDLTTLKNIVDAYDGVTNNWRVIGADISAGSNRDETRLYIDLAHDVVDAIGWIQPSEHTLYEHQNKIVHDQDLALRAILSRDLPAWLSIPPKLVKNNKHGNNCSALCITEGLQWAQTLGDAARVGFNVVFKPLDKADIIEPGFSFYISWLFKKTMGERVFDTKILTGDKFISHFYSHCTKDLSGAVTIMGINLGEMPMSVALKLSYRYSGPELWQYVLSIKEGIVRLNDEMVKLNSTYEPIVKIKHPSKPMSLVLPPLSIGFWILPSANIRECYRDDAEKYTDHTPDESVINERFITSSDRLLQQLIKENRGITPFSNRLKRHIVVKKDSNYLNQLIRDADRSSINHYTKPTELLRHKRFILKNNGNRPRLFKGIFDLANSVGGVGPGLTAASMPPPPPPPPPPPSVQSYNLEDENRRFKRVFPRLPFLKLEQLLNPRLRRARRQVVNFFNLGKGKPKLFPGFRKIMNPTATGQQLLLQQRQQLQPHQQQQLKPMMNEEQLLAPRKGVYFPEGDVQVNITKFPDADYDYVEFDAGETNKKKKKPIDVPDNEEYRRIPNAFHETYTITDIIPRVEKPFVMPPPKTAEVQNLGMVTHELEPTYNLNSMQLQKAQEQLETYYMPSDSKMEMDDGKIFHPAPKNKQASDDEAEGDYGYNSKSSALTTRKRKRRNAVLKSLSWALSQGDKYISNAIQRGGENQLGSDPSYEKIFPMLRLENFDRSEKPRSLEELQNISAEEHDDTINEVLTPPNEMEMNENGPDVAKIRIIAEGPASNPQTPKFMQYITTKLSGVMDMINQHVTGWWNTWV